jgi:hypothetical protein
MTTDAGLLDLFQVQFSTLLQLKLQQTATKLRGRVTEGAHSGAKMASPIQFLGALQMKTPAGRFAPKNFTSQDYSRRWIVPIDKELDVPVDNFDMLKTPIDPKSQIVSAAAAAANRAIDDEIIRAAVATSTIGADSGSLSTEAWDTAYQVASDFDSGSTSTGLSVAKLNEARRILEHNHAFDMDPQATLVIGSKQHADLRNQAQVTSADFNKNGGVLNNGIVTQFMGFDIVVSERLPVITDKDSKANTRGCLAFSKSAIYLGVWQDLKTEVFRLPTLSSNPWDVNVMLSIGATRTQLGQIVQICAADTTGADITV